MRKLFRGTFNQQKNFAVEGYEPIAQAYFDKLETAGYPLNTSEKDWLHNRIRNFKGIPAGSITAANALNILSSIELLVVEKNAGAGNTIFAVIGDDLVDSTESVVWSSGKFYLGDGETPDYFGFKNGSIDVDRALNTVLFLGSMEIASVASFKMAWQSAALGSAINMEVRGTTTQKVKVVIPAGFTERLAYTSTPGDKITAMASQWREWAGDEWDYNRAANAINDTGAPWPSWDFGLTVNNPTPSPVMVEGMYPSRHSSVLSRWAIVAKSDAWPMWNEQTCIKVNEIMEAAE